MSKLDQFESAFKSASKATYTHAEVEIGKVMVLTDLEAEASRRFTTDVRQFLEVLGGDSLSWVDSLGTEYADVGALLEVIEQRRPELICTYRNLFGPARDFPFSLGAFVDVLTQATSTPVLLMPPPDDDGRLARRCEETRQVMVLTGTLTGSDQMVHYGVRFVQAEGTLVLAHLEDDATFRRYIDTISKIPSIDTDVARETIEQQLLKEPRDYVQSCKAGLARDCPKLEVITEVRMGHRVSDCKQLVDDHDIDLMVLNTKDAEQLAMHGLAYPLAIELRHIPLLML